MNGKEAIKQLNVLHDALSFQRSDVKESADAIDTAIEALEKQIPKKPILRKCDNADCPCCGHSVNAFITTYDYYCGRCGQKLDWSENE